MSRSKNGRRCLIKSIIFLGFFFVLGAGIPWKAAAAKVYLPVIFKNYPIANPNFDLGRDGSWTEFSSHGFALILNVADLQGIIPQSGNWAAWLGGADSEISNLSQTIPIPPTANFLNFYYWLESFDPECGFDSAQVYLGTNLLQSYDLCQTTDTNGWTLAKIDVSTLRGQTLELSFRVFTDDAVDTWSNFFLDTIFFSAQ